MLRLLSVVSGPNDFGISIERKAEGSYLTVGGWCSVAYANPVLALSSLSSSVHRTAAGRPIRLSVAFPHFLGDLIVFSRFVNWCLWGQIIYALACYRIFFQTPSSMRFLLPVPIRVPRPNALFLLKPPAKQSHCRPLSVSSILYHFDMDTVDTSKRLAHLRALMKENKLDVYSRNIADQKYYGRLMLISAVVPSEDSHQSEYIAPCDARRGAHSDQ